MNKLYNNGGFIKRELIEKALLNAKQEGKLPNIPSFKIKKFVEGIEEEMEKFKGRVGTQITRDEVKFLINQLMRDKGDNMLDSEIKVIEEILLDKEFDIE